MRLRPVRFDRLDRTAVLRAAAPACRAFGRRLRCPDGSQGMARAEAKTGAGVQDKDPRRMVRDHGRHRHLLRPDPDHAGGAQSPAHGGAKDFCRAPRRHPAGARAALFPHAVRDPRAGDDGYCGAGKRVAKIVGWAKALFAPCPPISNSNAIRWWARFALPTLQADKPVAGSEVISSSSRRTPGPIRRGPSVLALWQLPSKII